jgi:HSP20 family protein
MQTGYTRTNRTNIKLKCSEKVLTIAVYPEERKYCKKIDLPTEVDPKVSKANYKNEVLDIILTKVTKKNLKGKSITID